MRMTIKIDIFRQRLHESSQRCKDLQLVSANFKFDYPLSKKTFSVYCWGDNSYAVCIQCPRVMFVAVEKVHEKVIYVDMYKSKDTFIATHHVKMQTT